MSRDEIRSRVVDVAAELLREQGAAAVTTRAVAQAAGVQTPVIYRLFADKDALLDAVAEHVFTRHVAAKANAAETGDPIADLRAAWFTHIGFGLDNPDLFALYATPGRRQRSPSAIAGTAVLAARVHRIAAIGRLRVPERRAVELIHAAGTGAVLTLISAAPEDRDPGLADAMYDAVMREILTDAPALPAGDPSAAVIAFRAVVPRLDSLSAGERAVLLEWLDRAQRRAPAAGAGQGAG